MFRSSMFAFAATAMFAVPALADNVNSHAGVQPEQVALMQANSAGVQATESAAVAAYNANVNPLATMLEKVGPYDLEDAFAGPHGYALPGWGSIANPSSMGGDASSGD